MTGEVSATPEGDGYYGSKFRQAILVMVVFIVITLLHLQSHHYWFLIKSVHVEIPPGPAPPHTEIVIQVEKGQDEEQVSLAPHPHILMMVADDMGWNDISWNNQAVRSPNLENLAKSGIILEQHYAQHICTPSRGTLLTGRLVINYHSCRIIVVMCYRYPIHIGLNDHGGALLPGTPHGMLPEVPTLADILRQQGYATHIVGKWHLGFCKSEYLPTSRGFDHHYGFWTGAQDYYTHKVRHGYDFRDDERVSLRDKDVYSTKLFQKRALKILRQHNRTQPLFLYIPFQSIHMPLQVPQEYIELYTNTTTNNNRATLLGMVTAMDDVVGNITAQLKKNGMFENTLIVFLSDNGAPVANSGSNWPLRGSKHTLFEGGTRVPAFVSGLGLKPRKESRMFHISDWLPTIERAVGINTHVKDIDGVSHWSALLNETSDWSRTELLYNIDIHKTDRDSPISAIRVGDWKYIWRETGSWPGWYPSPEINITEEEQQSWEGYIWKEQDIKSKGGNRDHVWKGWTEYPKNNKTRRKKQMIQTLLFNLANDPLEKNNVAEDNPDIVAKLEKRIKEHNQTMHIIDETLGEISGSPINRIWGTGWC